jgi:hypothetical protein
VLSGPTAYRLTIVRLIVTGAFILWFLAWVLVLFVLPRVLFETKSLRLTLIVGIPVMALAAGVMGIWQIAKREKELKAGYTTLINLQRSVDVRDPETGQVLLRSGDRFPKDRVSLAEAREFAARRYS